MYVEAQSISGQFDMASNCENQQRESLSCNKRRKLAEIEEVVCHQEKATLKVRIGCNISGPQLLLRNIGRVFLFTHWMHGTTTTHIVSTLVPARMRYHHSI